jgi:hypothetical protein
MVYFSAETTTEDSTATTTDGTTTSAEITTIEAAERISSLLSPFVQLVTVIVQALTAYTLLRQI